MKTIEKLLYKIKPIRGLAMGTKGISAIVGPVLIGRKPRSLEVIFLFGKKLCETLCEKKYPKLAKTSKN